jgi:hypothetical protein
MLRSNSGKTLIYGIRFEQAYENKSSTGYERQHVKAHRQLESTASIMAQELAESGRAC